MFIKFNLSRRKFYPYGLTIAALALWAVLFWKFREQFPTMTVPVTGFLVGFGYFLYSQHLHETKLFTELFRQFNERYGEMNGDLNIIYEEDESLSLNALQRQQLYDYFNLCAEEHLYFSAGYIDLNVWSSWERGMKHLAQNIRIKRLWIAEVKTESYYGFRPDWLIDRNAP